MPPTASRICRSTVMEVPRWVRTITYASTCWIPRRRTASPSPLELLEMMGDSQSLRLEEPSPRTRSRVAALRRACDAKSDGGPGQKTADPPSDRVVALDLRDRVRGLAAAVGLGVDSRAAVARIARPCWAGG